MASLKETFDKNVSLLNETQRKCEEYSNEIDLLNSRISKYEEEKSDEMASLKETFEENLSEAQRKCEEYSNEIHLLNSKVSKYEEEKNGKVDSLKETSDEKLNEVQRKCEEYKNQIDLLNSRISKYEEEKIIDLHKSQNVSFSNSFVQDDLVKSLKTTINELQAKIDSLTKFNNSLNLTIENIEEELKNVYEEKQSVKEELEKLSDQIACYKQEISVSTQKYNDEKERNQTLLLRLKENEKLILDNENMIEQLKANNKNLEKKANLAQDFMKNHKQEMSKKTSDLLKCHQAIEQLQQRIAELDKENLNLKDKTKIVEKQECLRDELNGILLQKLELEKEIKRLKVVETEKDKILKKLSEAILQRDNLSDQFCQLTSEFDAQKKRNTELEIKCRELSSSLKDAINSNNSLAKELNKNKNTISILNKQLEESSIELKNIKVGRCKLIDEISSLKSVERHLTQEIETLKKDLKDAKDNVKAECNKNQLLLEENKTLQTKVNARANIGAELQMLRNTLNGAYKFIVNILKTILCAVQTYPENADFEELRHSLKALIVHCQQNSEKDFQVNMFEQLNLFFGTLLDNHKDNQEICRLVSSIKESVKGIVGIDEPCQGAEASLLISPDTLTCNMSVFESTFAVKRNDHSCNILADLKYIKAQMDETIFNFKKIVSKKSEEIEKLKRELAQIPSTAAKNEFKTTGLDKSSFKCKMEIIKRQHRQLEEKYIAVVASSEKMKETIKKLEAEHENDQKNNNGLQEENKNLKEKNRSLQEENQSIVDENQSLQEENRSLQEENRNLDKEAEELSNEIKNMHIYYSNTDDLIDPLELNTLKQKLVELENKNHGLQKEIQEFQEFQSQQTNAPEMSSSADFNSLKHKLKELENENNWLRKKHQEFQLQQKSVQKVSSPSDRRQSIIPKFDTAYLKENNVNRCMKGS